jgi:PKD repeat protein
VNNVPPSVSIDSIVPALIPVGGSVTANGSFTDPGTLDTHTAVWDWGDTTTSGGTVSGLSVGPDSHTYTAPGIYTVRLTVTDDDSGVGWDEFEYVVVYDPDGGFVTGGGWIYSAPGAYVPDSLIEGKASFGFVSKYKKGATAPEGNTEFQFHAGDLNFHSSSYEWLVVTGGNYARFKGEGTINGTGDYKFMIWAGDADPDTFRIKIWQEDTYGTETVTYDNGFDQAIDSGSIVVHTKKK